MKKFVYSFLAITFVTYLLLMNNPNARSQMLQAFNIGVASMAIFFIADVVSDRSCVDKALYL